MLEAALIKECADPSLKPAIVEQFVQRVGSDDPLAITVKSGGRLILVPKPKTPEEAIEIVRENIGGSIVRVGLTQIPAGIGLKDASELKLIWSTPAPICAWHSDVRQDPPHRCEVVWKSYERRGFPAAVR